VGIDAPAPPWQTLGVSERAGESFPVTVAVKRADGRVEQVRVGTAVRQGDGFVLELGQLAIAGGPDAAAPAKRTTPIASSGQGMVFPPYGRSKGAPIAGASEQDLEYYAAGCRRTLADPAKSRWHDKERALLAAIEAELARQRGGLPPMPESPDEPPPPSDDDIPF
jgi:hypothetical protein